MAAALFVAAAASAPARLAGVTSNRPAPVAQLAADHSSDPLRDCRPKSGRSTQIRAVVHKPNHIPSCGVVMAPNKALGYRFIRPPIVVVYPFGGFDEPPGLREYRTTFRLNKAINSREGRYLDSEVDGIQASQSGFGWTSAEPYTRKHCYLAGPSVQFKPSASQPGRPGSVVHVVFTFYASDNRVKHSLTVWVHVQAPLPGEGDYDDERLATLGCQGRD